MKISNILIKFIMLWFIIVFIALYHSISIAWDSDKPKIDISTKNKCIKEATKLIDRGYPGDASEILRDCIDRYQDSKHLNSLYGRSLFLEGELSASKNQFRKLLKKDINDKEAFEFIKQIKLIEETSENGFISEFKSFIQNKFFDHLMIWCTSIIASLGFLKKKLLKKWLSKLKK